MQGEEISSYQDDLCFALTNPTHTSPSGYDWSRRWTDKQKFWRDYLNEGIIFKGSRYKDVEQAFQMNKHRYSSGNNTLFYENSDKLMLELIQIKLLNYPKLIEGIEKKGGFEYLIKCTHQPTKQNSHWETNGDNAFIKILTEAYLNIKNNK